MLKYALRRCRIPLALMSAFALAACFTSPKLLKEQRTWDATWQGRYQTSRGELEYVVLAADAEVRTYLIAQFEREKNELKTFRGATYPGWGDVVILGVAETGSSPSVTYYLLRHMGGDRVELVLPSCGDGDDATSKDPCSFSSIDALRKAIKPAYAKTLDQVKREGKAAPLLERLKATPPSTIGATEIATFEDGDGTHGALRIAPNAARPADMKAEELIVAVNGEEAASAAALLLMIAFEKPGAKVRLTLFDPATKKTRDVTTATVARPAS